MSPSRWAREANVAPGLHPAGALRYGAATMSSPTTTPAWKKLLNHARSIGSVHLRELFAKDASRAERMVLEHGGLHIDVSKHRATDETLALLVQLAEERGLGSAIARMFGGERINSTEDRAVLHVALRNRSERPVLESGH